MPGKDYAKMVEEARGLPALASVVTTVMSTVVEETSANEVAKIIEKDSSVTARILKVINSAYYGLSGHISTISQAVPLLGIQVVKNIVLTFSVLDIFPHDRKDGFNFQKLWEHSFATGVAARLLARQVRYEDPEEALVAGLLHDIGVLIFAKHDVEEYKTVLAEQESTGECITDLEQKHVGISHAELGALLAEKWRLPDVLIIPIRYHHYDILPEEMHRQATLLTHIIQVADMMCKVFTLPVDSEQIMTFKEHAQKRLEISDEVLVDILQGVTEELEEAAEAFMVNSPQSYIEILEQAHLELGRLNLAYLMQKQAIH